MAHLAGKEFASLLRLFATCHEASQKALRESISETERLVDESDKMLARHRKERDDHE